MMMPARQARVRTALGGLWLAAAAGAAAAALGLSSWGVAIVVGVAVGVVSLWMWARPGERRRGTGPESERAAAVLRRAIGPGPRTSDEAGGGIESLAQRVAEHVAALDGRSGRLAAVIDALETPVLATGAGGAVFLCNPAMAAVVGRPPAEVLDRPIAEVFTHTDLLELHASAERGHAHSRQVQIPGAAGPRVYEVAVSPLTWSRGVAGPGEAAAAERPAALGAVLTLREVTELARAVKVRTDFVSNASHELRTPIAAMRMAVETLAGAGRDDPSMRDRLVSMIAGHVQRLEEMTRDLLELSRLEAPELAVDRSPVPASELAAALAPMFEEVCRERRLALSFEFEPALERLAGDRALFTLILRNLIDNATRFAYEDTTIRVTGRSLPAAPGAAADLRLEVADQGIGIPLNQQQRVFERFYQVDDARTADHRRGTGLGLSIVKHAARTLGGQVSLRSVWKRGTTVTVEIPACIAPPAPPSAGEPPPVRQTAYRAGR